MNEPRFLICDGRIQTRIDAIETLLSYVRQHHCDAGTYIVGEMSIPKLELIVRDTTQTLLINLICRLD